MLCFVCFFKGEFRNFDFWKPPWICEIRYLSVPLLLLLIQESPYHLQFSLKDIQVSCLDFVQWLACGWWLWRDQQWKSSRSKFSFFAIFEIISALLFMVLSFPLSFYDFFMPDILFLTCTAQKTMLPGNPSVWCFWTYFFFHDHAG